MPQSTINLLENLVSFTSLRQKVISKNIANVNTAGYQREEVKFNDLLQKGLNVNLDTTNPKHISKGLDGNESGSDFLIVKDQSTEMTSGFNNVEIDREMADLAENTILYKFAARKLNSYFKSLQDVIRGGRG
jgi:flagellar basal-body rod protein FlgB